MTTIITLVIITAVFSGVFYGLRDLWLRFKPKPLDYPALFNPPTEGMVSDKEVISSRFAELVSERNGDVPIRPLLLMSSVAMVVAVAVGFAFLNLAYRNAPLRQLKQTVLYTPVATPGVTRADLVSTENPRIRVVIDDSDPDAAPIEDLLRRCAYMEITHVQRNGSIRCLREGSPGAKTLLDRDQQEVREAMRPPVMRQSVFADPATQVATAVANRKPEDRYAELVYFVLTFLGVFLRFCWEATQSKRRTKRSLYFNPQTIITSLVLAIATYAMIIQSGLAGSSDLLSFKTGIFATYNGLLSTGLLKDLGALRPTTSAAAPAP